MTDITFVVQGVMHPHCVANLFNYLRHGDVVFSVWKDAPRIMSRGAFKDRSKMIPDYVEKFYKAYSPVKKNKVTFRLHDTISLRELHRKGIYNYNNVFYQMYTTLHGMKNVDTKYVVKVRADEYYTDMDALVEKIKTQDAKKIVTTNTFFRKLSEFPWHPSDHVVGGETQNMKKLFKKGLEFCERGGYFLPEDASRFVGDDDNKSHSKYGFDLTSDGNGPRWDKTGDAFPTPVPEQVIGTSHLLLNHEGDIDFNNRKSLMAEYFSVVPVDDLGWYNLGQKKKVEWREGHVGDPGRWQWAEQKMSVVKSIGEIE